MVKFNEISPVQKFPLGQLLATRGAVAALEKAGQNAGEFLRRHVVGDWGDLCADDKKLNDEALVHGGRLLSSYRLSDGTTLWVITEAANETGSRECTTCLLPEDY